MKKIVLISLQGTPLEMSPARYQLLEQLHVRGYETYLFSQKHIKNRNGFEYIDHVINSQHMSVKDMRNKIKDINPHKVVASTYEDMKVVYILPWIMRTTSFFYYNLEIYTPYMDKDIRRREAYTYFKYKLNYPLNKLKEILYTKQSKAFTIQDAMRQRVSAKYHIKHKNTLFIPNSYNFNSDNIIEGNGCGIIYSGWIKKGFLIGQFEELLNVKNVPVTFVGEMDSWCAERVGKLKITNPNIVFRRMHLSTEEYTKYLKQFSVGLVWYSPLKEDEAHYYMGLSSGKMFKHLSLGQPVIAVKCPGISREINKYKMGVVIDSISELETAYEEIMKHYSYYQNNVLRVYRTKYDFKRVVEPFLDLIDTN